MQSNEKTRGSEVGSGTKSEGGVEMDRKIEELLKQLSKQEQQEAHEANRKEAMKVSVTGPDGEVDEFPEFFCVGFKGPRAQIAGKCTLMQMMVVRTALEERIKEALPSAGIAGIVLSMLMQEDE
jgi:hypothetical protein